MKDLLIQKAHRYIHVHQNNENNDKEVFETTIVIKMATSFSWYQLTSGLLRLKKINNKNNNNNAGGAGDRTMITLEMMTDYNRIKLILPETLIYPDKRPL